MNLSSKVTTLEQLRATAVRSQGLAAQAAVLAAEALEEMDAIKADKPTATAITIPTTGWTEEEIDESSAEADSSAYPYYIDLAVAGVTAIDRADITISPNSVEAATACGLCPTTETRAGIIRLRTVEPPAEPLAAEYWISSGKETN